MAGYIIESSAYFTAAAGRFCHWEEPKLKSRRLYIQKQLRALRRYDGLVDGIWGPKTIKAIQQSCALAVPSQYNGPQDGAVGINTVYGVIGYARQNNSNLNSLPRSLSSYYGSQKERYWDVFAQRLNKAAEGR